MYRSSPFLATRKSCLRVAVAVGAVPTVEVSSSVTRTQSRRAVSVAGVQPAVDTRTSRSPCQSASVGRESTALTMVAGLPGWRGGIGSTNPDTRGNSSVRLSSRSKVRLPLLADPTTVTWPRPVVPVPKSFWMTMCIRALVAGTCSATRGVNQCITAGGALTVSVPGKKASFGVSEPRSSTSAQSRKTTSPPSNVAAPRQSMPAAMLYRLLPIPILSVVVPGAG